MIDIPSFLAELASRREDARREIAEWPTARGEPCPLALDEVVVAALLAEQAEAEERLSAAARHVSALLQRLADLKTPVVRVEVEMALLALLEHLRG